MDNWKKCHVIKSLYKFSNKKRICSFEEFLFCVNAKKEQIKVNICYNQGNK